MNIRYICAQPANDYYRWQVEVLINNFIKHGVNPNQIDILGAINNGIVPDDWRKLQAHYNTVRFFFYEDTREDYSYIPSIYFNLMKQHLKANPALKDEWLFLHDSDIVFTRRPELDWSRNPNTWYMSDTNSYINYDYIQQKGNHIYEDMCNIIGIDKQIPKLMNNHSGGAQYLIKGEGFEFWDKVEKDAIKMYAYFNSVEHLHVEKYPNDYPIQKWTAGMWSLLWNAWLFGHSTEVDKRLGFGWSTDPKSSIDNYWILHNAGVMGPNQGLFHKASYINELPYGVEIEVDGERAGWYYWKEVQETALKSILVSKQKPYTKNKYTQMQLNLYNELASHWSEQNRDPVVGSFDWHNGWDDYENLFKRLENQPELVGLDFACGPGRNIVKYNGRFKRLDGVDISPINIEKAKSYTSNNQIESVLYTSTGVDINVVPSETYDFVMSTIALQHICVYDIRYSIMKDIHRVLKDGGVFTAQMGFGSPSPYTVGYYENYYDAQGSNRACDVCIETTEQLEKDLLEMGYKDFQYTIGPVGPGDCHPNWIYFSCIK
jgi:SAM-dependent methyltransferase